jgi:RimJ/RimL family protein N-acetyltransferase
VQVVLNERDAVGAFVSRGIPGCERGWDRFTGIGVDDGNGLVAGVVYHNWSPEAGVIEMSCAATSKRWCPPHVLKAIFGYPFDGVGCRMVVMRVAEGNTGMRRIAKRLGCKEYVIEDLRADGEADVVYTLTKAAWRNFIGASHGKD